MASDKGINFKYKHVGDGIYRPIIPVELSHATSLRYEVLVDSGADLCIFDAEVAEAIGIADIATGEKMNFGGVTGKSEVAYKHLVTMKFKGCSFQTKVAFSKHINDDGTGIVGQKGFFDRFSIKFDYPDKTIVLRKKDWA